MMDQQPVYLDEQGNPTAPVYLDEQGNPQGEQPSQHPHARVGEAIKQALGGLFSAPPLDTDEMGRRQQQMGDKHPIREGLEQAAMAAAAVPIGMAVSRGARAVSGLTKRLGDKSMKAALKVDRSYLQKMRGGRGAPIAAREQEIIDTANQLRINPVSPKGIDKTYEALDAANTTRQSLIDAAPDVPVQGSGEAAVRAGRKVAARLGRGEAPQERLGASLKTVQQIVDSPRTGEVTRQGVSFQQQPSSILGPNGRPVVNLKAVPGKEVRAAKDLRPRELADTISQTNEELRGLFGDTKLGPRAQTLMGTQSARRQALDDVAGTAANSDQMRRLIDLRNVQGIASHRAATHNPVSLTDVISISARRPAVAAASFGMKPRALGRIGATLSQSVAPHVSRAAAPAGTGAEGMLRSWMTLMASHEEEEQ